jgi:hypothetical protein
MKKEKVSFFFSCWGRETHGEERQKTERKKREALYLCFTGIIWNDWNVCRIIGRTLPVAPIDKEKLTLITKH